jgi:hypothetical protein
VVKNLPTKKIPGQDGFNDNSYNTFIEKIKPKEK